MKKTEGTRGKLSEGEIADGLTTLPGWSLLHDALHKEFRFGDFTEAFGFMTRVAFIAERMNHHPDWSNVYNRVVVDLSTHDVGGISGLDLEFARQIDRLIPQQLSDSIH
jgi:4a-hydroxytetrahydrobiopterin dehydratase